MLSWFKRKRTERKATHLGSSSPVSSSYDPMIDPNMPGSLMWNVIHADHSSIRHQLHNIMSAISDYAARVQAQFDTINTATDSIATHVTGVQADVTQLKALIEQLQNSQGGISSGHSDCSASSYDAGSSCSDSSPSDSGGSSCGCD